MHHDPNDAENPNVNSPEFQNPKASAGAFFATRYFAPDVRDMSGKRPGFVESLAGVPTEIFAHDRKEAIRFAKERKLGEIVVGLDESTPPLRLPSEVFESGDIPGALHAACWLGFVALRSGVISYGELLGDGGLIHNLAHLNLPKSAFKGQEDVVARIRADMPAALRRVESLVPGFTRSVPFDVSAHMPKPRKALKKAA